MRRYYRPWLERMEERLAPATTRVLDINQQPNPGGSGPAILGTFNGSAYFTASVPGYGRELWRSDGTEAGTYLVKDINPGASDSELTDFVVGDGAMFFTARDGTHGVELWRSDGTAAGTTIVKDISPEPFSSSFPKDLTVANGTLFFRANEGVHGAELWRSDGTAAGTALVKDIVPGIYGSDVGELTAVGNTLFFTADDGVNGTELWRSDGTAAGTALVKDIEPERRVIYWPPPASTLAGLINVNGTLFFHANDGTHGKALWKSDGTEAGTVMVKDVEPGSSYPNDSSGAQAAVGNLLYFHTSEWSNRTELWRSDGTEAGTYLVKSISGRPNSFPQAISGLTSVGRQLFFVAEDGVHGRELWRSDGTEAGTRLVKDIRPGEANSWLGGLTAVGGALFFGADDGTHGWELWKSDGTEAGTVRVADLWATDRLGLGIPFPMRDGLLLFAANDGPRGLELWRSDGTRAGTALVKDINTATTASSSPRRLTAVNGTVYFAADDGVHGVELWRSDGTAAGTRMVKDITAGPADSVLRNLTPVGETLFFTVTRDTYYPELWKTDGTEAGTVLVKGREGKYGWVGHSLLNVNGTLFFTGADGRGKGQLWKSDGTTAGTILVKTISLGDPYSAGPPWLTNVNGTLFFTAHTPEEGRELWKSDGTEAGTVRVKDINPTGDSNPFELTALNGMLYFFALGPTGLGLWRSDGTEAGTAPVKATLWNAQAAYSLKAVNGTLFFVAEDGVNGSELWKSDGTAAGTALVKDIHPGAAHSNPLYLTVVGGTLYFRASDGTHMRALWKSDGTEAGTVLVKDFKNQQGYYGPENLVEFAGRLFFTITDGAHGEELWRSDGTEAGTVAVDIAPGSRGSAPGNLLAVGPNLFFAALDSAGGVELWAYHNGAPALGAAPALLPATTPRHPNPAGGTVGGLLRAAADAEGDALGVAVIGAAGLGTWQYRTAGGAWRNLGVVTPARARLLRATDQLRFVPRGDFRGAATLTYRAWDQTAGTAGAVVNLTTASVGGRTAFSAAARVARLLVNHAPRLNPTPHAFPAISEDTALRPQRVGNLILNRVADADPAALKGVALRGATGGGVWQYSVTNGSTWAALGSVSDAAARLLRDSDYVRFIPAANWNGVATLQYRAWDRTLGVAGGLLDLQRTGVGGGWAVSAAVAAAVLVVRRVNDAPVAPATPVALPAVARAANPSGIAVALLLDRVTDADAGALRGVAVVGSRGGAWQYSTNGGGTWFSLQTATPANARLLRDTDLVRFVPGGAFAGHATLTFRAWDRTAGTAGGLANLAPPAAVGGATAFSLAARTAVLPVTE